MNGRESTNVASRLYLCSFLGGCYNRAHSIVDSRESTNDVSRLCLFNCQVDTVNELNDL